MITVSVRGYRNGCPGRYETFRVAWSTLADLPADTLDMRSSEARTAAQHGLVGVVYAQGAYRRNNAERWAQLSANEAQQLAYEQWLAERSAFNHN